MLVDLPSYPDWHPAIVETSGELRVGARQREVVRTGGELGGVLVPFLRGRLATDTLAQFNAALGGLAARLNGARPHSEPSH
ncbi:hypothetical protein [Rugosimonospora africana]|uniref:Uncharacterized protein n=1 Tax=Rugosimonospora africana TaxID=556532 RepID=A0A8J3R2U1_9ACTN|nr:hypothetical protein [Rugosimonospora africana]GIH20759.1 hypothetical protein Raf01_89310 [Rugosimonospora africana]